MNYILKLQEENKSLKEDKNNINEELTTLLSYLSSPKFHNDNTITVQEVYNRLIQIRMLSL